MRKIQGKKIRLNQRGKKNILWKGEKAGYRAIHDWVVRWLGQPSSCFKCGVKANGHKMHWANISGKYKRNLDDWVRLCVKCHKVMDKNKTEKERKLWLQ